MADPGRLFRAGEGRFELRNLFRREDADLNFLSASEVRIENTSSARIAFPDEEILLFNMSSPVTVAVEGADYTLEHYDVLYIPKGFGVRFSHEGETSGYLYIYRALADSVYEPFLSRFEEAKRNEERIRRLSRKIVYKMFDVCEPADKFIAGYTFYEDHTRAWPPHNHTDQEEVYSFIEGRGAMSVYEDDEHQHFVTSVGVGDHVTIPVLNYHPVYSNDEPLAFIWCIAGERYWVGDKNTEFMKGKAGKITT